MRIETRTMKIAMVIGLMAIALLGLGLPSAFALDGPTPPQLADPAGAVTQDEIQVIFFEVAPVPDGANAGAFTLTITVLRPTPPKDVYTTGSIGWNADATAVKAAIDAALGADGTVSVVGKAANYAPFQVTFGGGLAGTNVENMEVASTMTNPANEPVEPIISGIQEGATTTTPDVAPHGGYSSLTDYCLQCHQVHSSGTDPAGEYALMAEQSVTSTCATCHGYLGASPTGAEDPGFAGTEGTASLRAVYTAEPIHTIGATSSRTRAGWSFGWASAGAPGPLGPVTTSGSTGRRATAGTASTYGGGFYCGSCHTPHGEFGQLINAKWAVTTADQGTGAPSSPTVVAWAEGTRIYWNDPATPTDETFAQMYLHQDAPGASWEVCTLTGGGGTCYPAQTLDTEGQLVSLYGYKLLAYTPNHKYPVYNKALGGYLQPNGTYGTLPPGGLFANVGAVSGTLVQGAGSPTGSSTAGSPQTCGTVSGPCPTLGSLSSLGTLDANIVAGDLSFLVTVTAPTTGTSNLGSMPLPFKIRIDDEVMMVTAISGSDGAGYTLTVLRATENVETPWTNGTAAGHAGGTTVYRIPTVLVNEGTAAAGVTQPTPPYHITFADPSNSVEKAVVLRKTATTVNCPGGGTCFLYTIGRAVDNTPQNESHAAGTNIKLLTGSGEPATVKSWGLDNHDHDMATWCGTCHSGSVDVKYGGQYHAHPTGCTACHGNPTDGTAADFPHSSTNEFLLKDVPDALCLECHTAGSLP